MIRFPLWNPATAALPSAISDKRKKMTGFLSQIHFRIHSFHGIPDVDLSFYIQLKTAGIILWTDLHGKKVCSKIDTK